MRISSYDDIIIGGGSAGCVLGARLSQDGTRRVAVLEAGPHYPDLVSTPPDVVDGNTMSLVQHSWGLSAQLTGRRRTAFPQGRVTGGSSAVGNTVAIRGMPADYDEWAAFGGPLWSWDQVRPTLEALEDDLDFGLEKYHNAGGPTPIRRWRPEELTTVQQAFLDGCLAAGHPYAEDHNHPASYGVGSIPSTRRNATTRVSAAMAYLWPAAGRPNLDVRSGARVERVLIRDGCAVGVVVDGEELRAERVVLAAGAVHTPALLWRSGVGPADELRRLGIDVRLDRPGVGANLTDQPRIGVFSTPKPGQENAGASTGQIVLRTTSDTQRRENDMYYAMVNRFDLAHHFPALKNDTDSSIVYGVMAVARRANSRGSVTLTSADPAAAPRVDLGYLSDERDYQLFAEAVRGCWELATTPAVLKHGTGVVMVDDRTLSDDERMRAYIDAAVDTAFNPIGTARMGTADDEGAVVDRHLRVHGLAGLHVVDASVLPTMPCANPLLSVLMLAERAADLLRGQQR